MTEETFAIYRVVYLLPGSSRWEVIPKEFTSKEHALEVAQKLHDKYLIGENDESKTRVLLLATPMILEKEVVYDNGRSTEEIV
jgi:hypothetical protein